MTSVPLLDKPDLREDVPWRPDRENGLARLAAFLPSAGRRYASNRNHDLGPGNRSNVSRLSPWIRHRLLGEDEVVGAVIARHGYRAAEKFVQEVLWRTYWKGWLEMRPGVWNDYRQKVGHWQRSLATDDPLLDRLSAATEGRTGIECFDVWARELVEHGYLHNHTRMWFASIWIFTLKLPWELGADFFLRHLLDGDPASNTLSWRWVGGLQTPGKTYLARPANIAEYTGGRFETVTGLAMVAPPLSETPAPPPIPVPPVASLDARRRTGLLISEEDCSPETLGLPVESIAAVAGYVCTRARSPFPVGDLPIAFAEGAVADATARAGVFFGCPSRMLPGQGAESALDGWMRDHGLQQVVTAYPPVGPVQERLMKLKVRLAGAGIAIVYVRRDWDRLFWPHGTSGFFSFKERIPGLLALLSLLKT